MAYPKTYMSMPTRQNEDTLKRKARSIELEKADQERAQKRLDNDAKLDVNASKWRYVGER